MPRAEHEDIFRNEVDVTVVVMHKTRGKKGPSMAPDRRHPPVKILPQRLYQKQQEVGFFGKSETSVSNVVPFSSYVQ